MIDQPSQEADQEHDILRRQRLPMMLEAQKLAMFDEIVDALERVCQRCFDSNRGGDFSAMLTLEKARAIK